MVGDVRIENLDRTDGPAQMIVTSPARYPVSGTAYFLTLAAFAVIPVFVRPE